MVRNKTLHSNLILHINLLFSRNFSNTIEDLDNIVLQSLDNNTNSNSFNNNQGIITSIDNNIDINSILEQLGSPIPMLFSPIIN